MAQPNLLKAERVLLTLANWTDQGLGQPAHARARASGARRASTATVDIPVMPVRAGGGAGGAQATGRRARREAGGAGQRQRHRRQPAQHEGGRARRSRWRRGGRTWPAACRWRTRRPRRVAFQGRSKYLDVDDFLPPSQKAAKHGGARRAGKPPSRARPTAKPRRSGQPDMLQQVEGVAKLVVDRGRRGRGRLQRPEGRPGGEEGAAGGPHAGGGRPGRALLGRRVGVPAGRATAA